MGSKQVNKGWIYLPALIYFKQTTLNYTF